MYVWLLHPCNQLPGDAWRESRMHAMCVELVRKGHICLWWTANFSHHSKSFRSGGWKDIDVAPGYRIRLVPTPAYAEHVSVARLRFHWLWAYRTYKRGAGEAGPDCIIVNDSPLGDSFFALRLARRFNASLILDITDAWPEHFALAFPAPLRGTIDALLWPLYAGRKFVRRRADAISALCEDYFSVLRREVPDAQVPLLTVYNGVDVGAFRAIMNEHRASKDHTDGPSGRVGGMQAVYAGTLGRTYDIPVILQAAALLKERGALVSFVIAGDGPLRGEVQRSAQASGGNVQYVGRLKPEDLIRVYGDSDVGLSTYGPASTVAMPDKAYDYLAAGLVIVNSLEGELASWLSRKKCGLPYTAGDAASLADALERLSWDQQLRVTMARNASDAALLFDRAAQYGRFAAWVESFGKKV